MVTDWNILCKSPNLMMETGIYEKRVRGTHFHRGEKYSRD